MSEELEAQVETEAPEAQETPLIAEAPVKAESLLEDAETPGEEKGIPEWFKQDKYKTVEDQAKAYSELEKKMGSLKGAPEGDYSVPVIEGLDEGVTDNNPMVEYFKEAAREADMGQESFEKFVGGYLALEQQAFSYSRERERAALGDHANSRLSDLGDWGQANLTPEQWEIFKGVASTAVGVELMESMIGKTREARLARDPDAQAAGINNTAEELRLMRYAKTDNGDLRMAVDPEYKKQVDKAYADLYGAEA